MRSLSSCSLPLLALLLLLAPACDVVGEGPPPGDGDDDDGDDDDDDDDVDDGDDDDHDDDDDDVIACLAVDAPCDPASRSDKPCCDGLTCASIDDGEARCTAPLPPCVSDADCGVDEICADGACVYAPLCVEEGGVCEIFVGACCPGTFCSTETIWAYGAGTCIAPQELGAVCSDDAQCASGACTDFVCAEPDAPTPCGTDADCGDGYCVDWMCQDTCLDVGSTCQGGCCPGTFCSVDVQFSYAGGTCVPPLPNESSCVDDAHCESGACVDFVCADPPACVESGGTCTLVYDDQGVPQDDVACCDGLACLDGWYLVGTCGAPLATGAFCWRDGECASGVCGVETMTCD